MLSNRDNYTLAARKYNLKPKLCRKNSFIPYVNGYKKLSCVFSSCTMVEIESFFFLKPKSLFNELTLLIFFIICLVELKLAL